MAPTLQLQEVLVLLQQRHTKAREIELNLVQQHNILVKQLGRILEESNKLIETTRTHIKQNEEMTEILDLLLNKQLLDSPEYKRTVDIPQSIVETLTVVRGKTIDNLQDFYRYMQIEMIPYDYLDTILFPEYQLFREQLARRNSSDSTVLSSAEVERMVDLHNGMREKRKNRNLDDEEDSHCDDEITADGWKKQVKKQDNLYRHKLLLFVSSTWAKLNFQVDGKEVVDKVLTSKPIEVQLKFAQYLWQYLTHGEMGTIKLLENFEFEILKETGKEV